MVEREIEEKDVDKIAVIADIKSNFIYEMNCLKFSEKLF